MIKTKPRSLRLRLLIGLLLPLSFMLALDVWLTYERGLQAANQAFDRLLYTSARAIADGVAVNNGQVSVDIPYFALQLFESSSAGKVFYRVSNQAQQTLTGYADLPLANYGSHSNYQPDYRNILYQGERLRQITLRYPVRDMLTLQDHLIWIQVAETPESRQALASTLSWGALLQESILVVMTLAIVLFAINRGLRPLRRLSRVVAQRQENEFTPLSLQGLPKELLPLVQALNLYISRLKGLVVARRRFIDDAAHQLKTPLAVMQAQAELALRASQETAVQQQLRPLLDTLKTTSHGVQQLLQMSRLEPDNAQIIPLAPLDIDELTQRLALEWATLAHQQGIDLGYESAGPLWVLGHEALLQELLSNLLDNAMRYRHPQRPALITVATGHQPQPYLQVRDNGLGIRANERDKVLQRFYRLHENGSTGSGLGLAIVREIVSRHQARLELSDSLEGGLTVTVFFNFQKAGMPGISEDAEHPLGVLQ